MAVNIHLTDTTLRNESRILKQTLTIKNNFNQFDSVAVVGMEYSDENSSEVINGIEFVRVSKKKYRMLPRGFSRVINFLRYCRFVLHTFHSRRVSLINVHRWWILPFAVTLKFIWGARILYDPHELETETVGLTGLKKALAKISERISIGFVDSVVVVGPKIAEIYGSLYPGVSPHVVMNCANYRKLLTKTEIATVRKRLGIPLSSIVIMYHGGLSRNRGIEKLVASLKVEASIDVVMVFLGFGELKEWLCKESAADSRIVVLDAVAPEKIHEIISSVNIGFFLYENNCLNHRYCLPNKLFEYLMSGIFIVSSQLPEIMRVMERYEYGMIVEPDKQNYFSLILSEYNSKEWREFNEKSRLEFSWESQECNYISAVNESIRGLF